jgi:hypothetical protein
MNSENGVEKRIMKQDIHGIPNHDCNMYWTNCLAEGD